MNVNPLPHHVDSLQHSRGEHALMAELREAVARGDRLAALLREGLKCTGPVRNENEIDAWRAAVRQEVGPG